MYSSITFKLFNKVSMILELFLVLAGLWLIASLTAYFFIKKSFKKYKNYPRLEYDEKTEPIVRKDMAKWDEAAILKGCFLRFPLHTFAMAGFLSCYALVAYLQRYLRYPMWLVNAYRLYMGRLTTHICFNLIEEFDPTEKSTTPIVISNHVSWIDFIYMGTCIYPVSFLAKKEIQKVIVFNTIADSIQTLYVDRSSPEARHRIKEQILERVNQYNQNPTKVNPLIIYPEGTVTNGRSIISFKNGAFEPLAPITILCLRYQCKQFHMGLNEISALDHGLFAMCLNPTLRVRRTIVQPKESETVEEYRERCRQQLGTLSGFKLYDSDFRDLLNYENKIREMAKEKRNAGK